MTVIISVIGREAIWLAADRRLSRNGLPVKEDATKVTLLETMDGRAILGYAGIGLTQGGVEPSDWLGAILRGRNCKLDHAMNFVKAAFESELPRFFRARQIPCHHLLTPCFIEGRPWLYVLRADAGEGGTMNVAATAFGRDPPQRSRPPTIAVIGSGAVPFLKRNDWHRPIWRLVKAHNRNLISAVTLADHLGELIRRISMDDRGVGDHAIVAWRGRDGGGETLSYRSGERIAPSDAKLRVPTVVTGIDLNALLALPHVRHMMEAVGSGTDRHQTDPAQANAELSTLPGPDDRLR